MYGVIDIGSNTIRLVVYQVNGQKIKPMFNKKFSAGIAGYINDKNRITKEGIEKAVHTLCELKMLLESVQIEELFVFATASLRNIDNTQEALDAIYEGCGYQVQVLTGEEEARFDYYGAVEQYPYGDGLIVDIGGGSTELVFFQDNEIKFAKSLPIGSLNLYVKYVKGILPNKKEMADIEKEVQMQLKEVQKGVSIQTLCVVGGSARAIVELLEEQYEGVVQNRAYDVKYLKKLTNYYQKKRRDMTRNILKVVPERIHTILPGVLALKTIVSAYGAREIITSDCGVREGYLRHVLKQRGEGL